MILAALNFCINRCNSGIDIYWQKVFLLYQLGFEKKILLEDGLISGRTFTNAVWSGLKLREFDWAEDFISKNQQFIEEKNRTSVVHFNRSRLHFERGEYNQAMQLMLGFEYDDLLWNLIAKTMLLKIYYEQGFYDALESHLEAMRAYLQRKEILGYHKANYKNILSLTRKLLHLNPFSLPQKEKIKKLVAETNPLTEREWLLRQLQKR